MEILAHMETLNILPTSRTLGSLIHGFTSQGNLAKAERFFSETHKRNFPIKRSVYRAMIDCYGKNKKMDEVMEVWKSIPERDNVSTQTVMNYLVQHGLTDQARKIICDPNHNFPIATLMEKLEKQGKQTEAALLLNYPSS